MYHNKSNLLSVVCYIELMGTHFNVTVSPCILFIRIIHPLFTTLISNYLCCQFYISLMFSTWSYKQSYGGLRLLGCVTSLGTALVCWSLGMVFFLFNFAAFQYRRGLELLLLLAVAYFVFCMCLLTGGGIGISITARRCGLMEEGIGN